MFWLFGQIWLWLIISFALGALCAWLVLRVKPKPEAEHEPELREPEPASAEQTQFIPAAQYHAPEPHPEDDDEPVGHREGHLPMPPQRGPDAEDWPTEEEPAWPQADEADAAPEWHQPGRSG